MSGGTEIIINHQSVEAQLISTGINVTVGNAIVNTAIVGIPGPKGLSGIDGTNGADGAVGPKGDAGIGVPSGGATGQVSIKQSNLDYDLSWSDNIYLDPANGRVGFGTSSPSRQVHIFNATTNATSKWERAGLAQVEMEAGAYALFGTVNGYPVRLITAGVERLHIEAAGNVGIGTPSPSTKLHVDGPVRCGSYTIATLPGAAIVGDGAIIFISDETGGATLAYSDGTDWRRMADRVIVS